MLDKLNFGVLLKIRGICSNLWHYFKELNGNMAGICSHEDFKIIFDKMLLDHNLNFKVEDKEVFEETAAKEALKYLNKIEEKAKGEVKEDVKVTKETKVKENKLNKTNKDLMNKKLGRSKSELSPLNKLTRTLTKFKNVLKLVRVVTTLNSKSGTNYKKDRSEFSKLPSKKKDERNTSLFNTYFEDSSVESWKKLTGI
uniref:Uncharacterized protein n=1 Tax=Meloidogyne incognita TaxID=6306 RepID=A0A914NAL5_MELIC